MRGNSFIEKATILAGLAGNVDAFWRLPCRGRTAVARIDPLVNYNSVGLHAHSTHGSGGLGIKSGYDELMASNCTSCSVTQDKSAYWTPSIYFKNAATGKFQLVEQVGGMLAYYLLYGDNIKAFPKGFSMIAGDNEQRNFSYPVPDVDKSSWNQAPYNTQSFLKQVALGFNCLNYGAPPEPSLYRHSLPNKAYLDAHCADGVRFEIMFPSCWNEAAGVSSPDSKAHVAYPSLVMGGDCPKGFDTRLPSLFYETIWNTAAFKGVDGDFFVSNGDPTGCGYHADFVTGWKPDFLQSAIDTCTNLSGKIEDCPLFQIQDESGWGTCKLDIPEELRNEDVTGPMDALPGNNPIQAGPERAVKHGAGAAANDQKPATDASGASPAPAAQGGVFAAVADKKPDPTKPENAAITAPPAAAELAAAQDDDKKGYYSKSVQTTTKCNDGDEVIEIDETFWVEDTVMVNGAARKRHVHKHGKGKRGVHGHY
ncbi:hypothetical protein DSL72_000683 [Monilinia vaccinii-corymbosi]|uniref:DUF1996 domain-containing protein n=1 Tax=Monilinia vaccinii-corymbosi TaxID=61207 RepID=A0A8A3P3E8_9HELO|nr:hypothetical protein DSL72_000683 [Monilinia vaccinii-corymbosi]